jgi:SAM-dependent methyltransferase
VQDERSKHADSDPSIAAVCAACGASQLEPHLRVAGSAGTEGLIPTTTRFGVALSDIVRCPRCGHMQLADFPSAETLLESYAEAESSDYLEEEAGQRATALRLLAEIERHAPRGRLLDLGCWTGFLLDEARLRGWSAVGVEPSEFGSRFARERLGLDVITSDLFTAPLEPGSFDAVVMGDVIEHLPDPGAALDHIASLARPGAVLQLALPDAGSAVARRLGARWWSVIPTHVQYFTRGSLSTLLTRHGWEVLELNTAPKAFTVDYYLGRIGGYSRPAASLLQAAAARLQLGERIWAPDFRDRISAIARAPSSQA